MPDAPARKIPSAAMTAADIHAAIVAAWRIEQPRLITSLSRMLRDVPLAEELTQDALWPRWKPGPRQACRNGRAPG
jgi:predicted RNA polymerase sigma factor